jgi:hypothetical protein
MRHLTSTRYTVGYWRHLNTLGSLSGTDAPERLSLAVLSRDKWATESFDKVSATLSRHGLFPRVLLSQVLQLTTAQSQASQILSQLCIFSTLHLLGPASP